MGSSYYVGTMGETPVPRLAREVAVATARWSEGAVKLVARVLWEVCCTPCKGVRVAYFFLYSAVPAS